MRYPMKNLKENVLWLVLGLGMLLMAESKYQIVYTLIVWGGNTPLYPFYVLGVFIVGLGLFVGAIYLISKSKTMEEK